MITFHLRHSASEQRARKNEHASALNYTSQIAPSICTLTITKRDKPDATIFKSRCSRTAVCYRLNRVDALPLIFIRLSRLANSSPTIQRTPARRSRNGRDTTDKTTGETSRVKDTLCRRNRLAATNLVSPDDRRGDWQDNLPCAEFGRATTAQEIVDSTRNMIAQQLCRSPRNGQCKISQAALLKLLTSPLKNYEHIHRNTHKAQSGTAASGGSGISTRLKSYPISSAQTIP